MKENIDEKVLIEVIAAAIQDKKGKGVVSLDLSGMDGAICSHFVVCNADSTTQVSAIADGVVVLSEWSPEAGHSIVIQHKDNYLSVYRHLSGVLLSKGERVQGAQAIGYAGSDKDAELSMLEFELWREGKAVNPELYIIF